MKQLFKNKVLIGVVGLGLAGLIAGGLALGKSTSRVGVYRSDSDNSNTIRLSTGGIYNCFYGEHWTDSGTYHIQKNSIALLDNPKDYKGADTVKHIGIFRHDKLEFPSTDSVFNGNFTKD